MTATDWLAIAAVALAAISVLPGTLGFLMLTNRIAVSEAGARYIYGGALWVALASAALLGIAAYRAVAGGAEPGSVFWSACAAYAGIMIFGFFMHTKFMFRPVKQPKYMSVDEAVTEFGPEEEVVGVVDPAGKPYAYVSRLARRPHIVYQPEGEHPFIMSHCILAHSSMAYAMQDRFNQPDITITAALANNLVFYDKANQCTVIQLHNASRDRQLPLKTVPTVTCSLATWQRLYPNSPVWYRNREWRDVFYLKLLARADVIDPNSPVMVYPLQNALDERLPMKAFVLGLQIGGETRSYPVSLLEKRPVLQDSLAGVDLAIFSAFGNDYINVYDRDVDGRVLDFRPAETADSFTDEQTGSHWAPTGECVSGELTGKRLALIPHYNKIFWYVWADFHPGTPIYGETASGTSQSAA